MRLTTRLLTPETKRRPEDVPGLLVELEHVPGSWS
jgi:hypothetical protein